MNRSALLRCQTSQIKIFLCGVIYLFQSFAGFGRTLAADSCAVIQHGFFLVAAYISQTVAVSAARCRLLCILQCLDDFVGHIPVGTSTVGIHYVYFQFDAVTRLDICHFVCHIVILKITAHLAAVECHLPSVSSLIISCKCCCRCPDRHYEGHYEAQNLLLHSSVPPYCRLITVSSSFTLTSTPQALLIASCALCVWTASTSAST